MKKIVFLLLSLVLLVSTAFGAIGTDGYTILQPAADSTTFYVSSSTGMDTNPGTQALPFKTLGKAIQSTQNGTPTWILLRGGDVFPEGVDLRKSGRGPNEPLVITSYGTGRASIQPPSGARGIDITANTAVPSVHDIAIVGIDLYAKSRDPSVAGYNPASSVGLWVYCPVTNLLIEDCSFRYFGNNLVIQGQGTGNASVTNFSLRRSVIADSYESLGAHSQGIYLTDCGDSILIEENVFDHNGWNAAVAGAEPTVFNHQLYLDNENYSDNNIVRNNIFVNGSSHGAQVRRGGKVVGNFVWNCPLGILVGGGDGYQTKNPNGVPCTLTNNVVLESGDITPALPRGYAFDLVNISGGTVADNIAANDKSAAAYGHGFSIDAPTTNLAVNNNIVYNWHNPFLPGAGISITQSNNYFGAFGGPNTPGYLDTTRSLGSYNATLGGASTSSAFLSEARKQSKSNWRTAYTASAINSYIRAGFSVAPVVVTPPPDATVPTATLATAPDVSIPSTSYSITVTYADNVGIDIASLGSSQVQVKGPNSFNQFASFVSVDVNTNGTPRTAAYKIIPPGGTWSASANGVYTILLQGGKVKDTSGNAAAAASLGAFSVAIPTTTPTPTPSPLTYNVTITQTPTAALSVTVTDSTGKTVVTGPVGTLNTSIKPK